MKLMNSYHKGRLCVKAKADIGGATYTFTVKGKTAKTLLALVKSQGKGITALELSNTWAVRLSAYIYNLRHKNGLEIRMYKESHPDGWHGRYILRTPIKIIEHSKNNKI